MGQANQEQNITVQITKSFDGLDVDFAKLTKLVKSVCSRFRLSKATVSIAIVDDSEIRRVNKEFLSSDNPTDCLSFDLSDESNRSKASKLFELVVNGEKALKEAKLRGHSGKAELALYITHGLLHNLGFDDSTKAEAKKMHDTEDEILQQLGYGMVYNKNKTVQ
ncbi:MAG: rRNA maturation RNase YbeY [Phycisphaerae bacterium]|nr:rRNA maturation RNase YbeY [Phycisphaerae bacterium]